MDLLTVPGIVYRYSILKYAEHLLRLISIVKNVYVFRHCVDFSDNYSRRCGNFSGSMGYVKNLNVLHILVYCAKGP